MQHRNILVFILVALFVTFAVSTASISTFFGQGGIDNIFLPVINNGQISTPTPVSAATETPVETPTQTPVEIPTQTPVPTQTPIPTPTTASTSACPTVGLWTAERARRLVFSVSDVDGCQVDDVALRTVLQCTNGRTVTQTSYSIEPAPITNGHFRAGGGHIVSGDFSTNNSAHGEWTTSYSNCSASGAWIAEPFVFPSGAVAVEAIDYSAAAFKAADIDGDGDADLLVHSQRKGSVWLENLGDQQFLAHPLNNSALFDDLRTIEVVDLDGDNDLDILSLETKKESEFWQEAAWWENDGAGNFTEHVIGQYTSTPISIIPADMDGDNDVDIVIVRETGGNFHWWENDGEQNFTDHTIGYNLNGLNSVRVADMDGDNDMDLLTALSDFDSNSVSWWENDGTQAFTEHVISDSYVGVTNVYAADINSDGRLDIVTAAPNNKVGWWENNGEGSFIEQAIPINYLEPRALYVADMDGDSNVDILVGYAESDAIVLYKNTGSGTFVEQTIGDGYFGVDAVFSTDIDDDGLNEFIGSSSLLSNVLLWSANVVVNNYLILSPLPKGEDK